MTTEHEDSPVRHFCAQLDGLVRAAGRTRSSVVGRHPMSDSQVYAVLAGTVKTPPSFDRMVVPIIEICGGDAAAIAAWRARHDAMVRVYELQRSLRRKAADDPPAERETTAEVAPRPAGRPRWAVLIAATVVVTGLLASGLTWAAVTHWPAGSAAGPAGNAGGPAGGAGGPAGGAGGPAGGAGGPAGGAQPRQAGLPGQDGPGPGSTPTPCTAGAPAGGGDLLDVPRPAAAGDPRFDEWWSTDPRVRLEARDTHRWTAVAESGAGARPWDMLIIRGCLPVTAGHRYALRFTASASTDVNLAVRVQENRSPWPESLMEEFRATGAPAEHSYTFVGAVTSPSSELTFQLGGNPAARVEISDIVLIDLGV